MTSLRASLRSVSRRLRRLLPRRPGPAILMYHRIAGERFDPWGMAVGPSHFAEQAEWLARSRKVLPLSEFVVARREGKLPTDAVAITFDDGYACTFTAAAPILDRLGLPATVFVPAAAIRDGGEFWWDELEPIVFGFDGSRLSLDGRDVKLGRRVPEDRAWRPFDPPRTARQEAFHRLWSILHPKSGKELLCAMADLRQQIGGAPVPRESHRVASVDELRSSALAIGCHGLTHASLLRLSRPDQEREIQGGKALLADLTGTKPIAFAYPFGDVDSEVRDIVAADGFAFACGSRQSFVRAGSDDFALPRLVVENSDARGLERMLSGR